MKIAVGAGKARQQALTSCPSFDARANDNQTKKLGCSAAMAGAIFHSSGNRPVR
ncbi:MAG: hypothetical protein ACREUQ_10355 [Burkholderiales bacterium]